MSSELSVRIAGLEFPRVCPACGQGASTLISIRKAFVSHDEDSPEDYVLHFDVYFCRDCAARHEREEWKPGPLDLIKRLFSDPGTAGGAIIVGVVGLLFLKESLLKVSPALLAFSLLPLGIAFWLLRRNWEQGAKKFLPPPTSVTSHIDFSDIAAEEYEPDWIRFRLLREDYASAFRKANEQRIWDPGGGEAMAARQKREWSAKRNQWFFWAFAAVVLALSILSWLMGWDS